jgi:hypothetical protein
VHYLSKQRLFCAPETTDVKHPKKYGNIQVAVIDVCGNAAAVARFTGAG